MAVSESDIVSEFYRVWGPSSATMSHKWLLVVAWVSSGQFKPTLVNFDWCSAPKVSSTHQVHPKCSPKQLLGTQKCTKSAEILNIDSFKQFKTIAGLIAGFIWNIQFVSGRLGTITGSWEWDWDQKSIGMGSKYYFQFVEIKNRDRNLV